MYNTLSFLIINLQMLSSGRRYNRVDVNCNIIFGKDENLDVNDQYINRNIDYDTNGLANKAIAETIDEKTDPGNYNKRLAKDYIYYRINLHKSSETRYAGERNNVTDIKRDTDTTLLIDGFKNRDLYIQTINLMRKSGVELEKNHIQVFNNLPVKLQLNPCNARAIYESITKNLLENDEVNWGRLVALFAFSGKLAEWFLEQQEIGIVEDIVTWLADTISDNQEYIDQNGGWVSFIISIY